LAGQGGPPAGAMSAPDSMQVSRDGRLVKKMLAGDEAAQRQFFNEYFPRLYRYARHRLHSEADVEDVVQSAICQAARRLETYRGESTLLTWLVQICRNEISRQYKRQEQREDHMLPFLNDDLLRAVVESVEIDDSFSPEQQSKRMELIGQIQLALDQLPENYASALEMKYVQGLSSKEIAKLMQLSDEAIQSLLARARRAFKEVFGEALNAQN